ncbi:Gustatory receptor 195 [Halyomorpha halys]|nr:Gustatory receptor 195 [Halyomorpha halys]
MIRNRRLETFLAPIVAMQWLGLSPGSDKFTSKRITSISFMTLLILLLTAGFNNSVFFVSVLCSGLANLYYIGRNIFDYEDFGSLLETYQKMNSPYTFSWTFVFLPLDIVMKMMVCYFQGVVISDILLLIHFFKTIEIDILVYILRCQSELLKNGELNDYRLINRSLGFLRSYLLKHLPVTCFLYFLWCSNGAFIGIKSFSKILLTPDGSILECTCYWTSFFFSILSMVALISSYNGIEEQKVEFEDRLYWRLVSSSQVWNSISPKHLMLFEICSRKKKGETLKIDNTLIYSIISSIATFLVILIQFELEEIICGRQKENT